MRRKGEGRVEGKDEEISIIRNKKIKEEQRVKDKKDKK